MGLALENRQWLAGILAVGLVLRLLPLIAAFLQGDALLLHEGDTGTYQTLAYAMAHGDFLFGEGHAREMAYIRTPGYPLLLGIGYALGLNDFAIAFAQILLDAGAIYLVYRLGEQLGKVGWQAALLYAISPMFILFSFKLVTESFFIFVFLLANVLFFEGRAEKEAGKRLRLLAAAGLVFGFLILVRPVALVFPLFYAGILYLSQKPPKPGREGNADGRRWKELACLLLLAYAVAGLWVARNFVVLHQLSFSRIGTISYACWTGPLLANDPRVDLTPWQAEYVQYGLNHPDNCTQRIFNDPEPAAKVVTQMVVTYPLVYLQHMANAVVLLFSPQTPNYILDILGQERPHLSLVLFERGFDLPYILAKVSENPLYLGLLVLFAAYQAALYLLFLLGIWRERKTAEGRMLLGLVGLVLLYIIVLQGPQLLFSGYRYRMPVEPLLIIGAAWGWNQWKTKRGGAKKIDEKGDKQGMIR